MITIKKENYFSEPGRCSANEDSFAYIPGSTYLVCDGTGGTNKGDVASQIVVKSFVENFRSVPNSSVDHVLRLTESLITKYVSEHPDSEGMGSTLAFAQIRNDGVYIAWIGNSRIYQFRNGELIYFTADHNWSGEAIRAGILTPEEAVNHPKSEIVTRLIQGTHKATRAESGLLTDVKRGDVFLLCSDGVAEAWSNEELVALFKFSGDLDELRAQLISKCSQYSDDNYTGIILQVHDARIPSDGTIPYAADTEIEQLLPNSSAPSMKNFSETRQEITIDSNNKEKLSNEEFTTPVRSIQLKKYIGYAVLLFMIGIVFWKWPSKTTKCPGELLSSGVVVSKDTLKTSEALPAFDTINKNSDKRTQVKPLITKKKAEMKSDSSVNSGQKDPEKNTNAKNNLKKRKKKKNKSTEKNSGSDNNTSPKDNQIKKTQGN